MSLKACLKHGGKSIKMSWLNGIKVALIQKDAQKAFACIQELPESFVSLDEMLEARELIAQVIDLLEEEKNHTRIQMLQIKAAKKFLEING